MQLNDKNADRNIEMMKVELQAEKDIQVAQINASSRSDVQELRGVVELLKQRIDLSNTPQNWLQQGEGVDNYAPTTAQNTSLSEGLEPQPDMSQTEVESPATEQGFLMPEESAQPENLAPSPDQIGESALIENGGMPPMEQQDGPQF